MLLLTASAFASLPIPPAPTQWVTDSAGILSASDRDALNSRLREFEQRSGTQFIVYILPTLDDEALEDFTIRAAEKWKVGQKKYDNGLILFVFIQEKRLRIETGYGLEPKITDSFASDIVHSVIPPYFGAGRYAAGLNAAADQIIARIEGNGAPGEAQPASRPSVQARPLAFGDIVPLIIILLVFIFFVAPLLRRGGCGCGGCFPIFPMGGGGMTFGGGGGGWGGGGGGFGGGGFSGGGGGFGGGGASGGW
ncbi:MAG: TPM domain-containing protein [Acidobacteriota bacterium]